jgi:hypothetical protein
MESGGVLRGISSDSSQMARGTKKLRARPLIDLRTRLDGWSDPVVYGVGLDGAVYACARRSDEVLVERSSGAIFPKSRLQEPTDWLLLRWHAGEIRQLVHRAESMAISHIQPLPRDGLLLASARCRWREGGAERNAMALDWSGRELDRFTLGDGIEDVRVAPDGTIWTSYFDEGVFGNYGWGNRGPIPIGAPGLVAFTPEGEVALSYDAECAGTDRICDVYAMTITAPGDVWVYFYTEFPIVRIHCGEYRTWSLGTGGAKALAVQDERVFLLGDYREPSLGRIVHLGDAGEATVAEEVTVVDPLGKALDRGSAMGVGDRILLMSDRRVTVLDEW